MTAKLKPKQLQMLTFLRSRSGEIVTIEEARAASGLSLPSWKVYWNAHRYAPYLTEQQAEKLMVTASPNLTEEAFYQQVRQSKSPPSDEARPNKLYRLEKIPLGTGGYAEVWRGTHRESGATRAIKIPLPGEECAVRLKREIDAMLQLDDVHIMPVEDYDLSYRWYCMPVATGALWDLRERAIQSLEELVSDVANGLEVGHREGYVHRDITPGNILLLPGPPERWVVGDWGTVRKPPGTTTVQRTQAGRLLGTEAFAAPELWIDASNADLRCDIYGLGRVVAWAHEMKLIPNVPSIPRGPWETFVEETTRLDVRARPQSVRDALALAPKPRMATCAECGQTIAASSLRPVIPRLDVRASPSVQKALRLYGSGRSDDEFCVKCYRLLEDDPQVNHDQDLAGSVWLNEDEDEQ